MPRCRVGADAHPANGVDAPGGYGWMGGFARAFLRPAFVFILVAVIVAFLIVGIGQLLLALHPEMVEQEVSGFATTVKEFFRPDLLTAFALSLLVLFGGAFLARPRRPRTLDEPVAIGERPFFAPVEPPPTHEEATSAAAGHLGGHPAWFTLYARNGALARSSPSSPPRTSTASPGAAFLRQWAVRRKRRDVDSSEAVYVVYPETCSAFLAAKGDEIEHFGWNLPPESFRRGPASTPRSIVLDEGGWVTSVKKKDAVMTRVRPRLPCHHLRSEPQIIRSPRTQCISTHPPSPFVARSACFRFTPQR